MIENDDVMQLFIEESREHLEGIEENLLRIEQTADALDGELVNAVFRTLHTIKGGAGFFSLVEVKNLAHAMENILDAVRRHELVPTPPIVSELLDASDLLRRMINDVEGSRGMRIEGNLARLHAVMQTTPPPAQAPAGAGPGPAAPGAVALAADGQLAVHSLLDNRLVFTVPVEEVLAAQIGERGGVYVYLLEFDGVADIEARGRGVSDYLAELGQTVNVVRCEIDRARLAVSPGARPAGERLPAAVLCASIIEPDIMRAFADLPEESVQLVADSLLEGDALQGGPAGRFAPPAQPLAAPAASPAAPEPADGEPLARAPGPREGGEQSVRVNLRLLDRLMNLAGELVLARNALLQSTASGDPAQVKSSSHGIDAITSQLQEAIISTRMQGIGIVFGKFRRIVRDLSKQLGKKVVLDIRGEEVDLDKTVIEAIGDPLTHLVRNSMDHGLETPERRLAAGKPEEGRLELSAAHEAGQVVIEIRDDGAGIDPARVRAKALEKGLGTREELDRMSDKEACRLIFRPGFSTAEKVTEISGRGVGMDVVQQNLARVGGVIDLDSSPGRGTTIRIKLPLTLAIIPSVLVTAGRERFAIPQVNLVELVRVAPGEVRTRIERIGEASVLRLRGDILPVVTLADLLAVAGSWVDEHTGERHEERRNRLADRRADADAADAPPRNPVDRRQNPQSAVNLVILAAGTFKYGLVVDELLDSVEIVVKPLGKHFAGSVEYAGATILGDGTVAMILDVAGVREAMQLRETRQLEQRAHDAGLQMIRGTDRQSVLIVENAPGELFAIPAQLVARIEKIAASALQDIGGRKAVSYRGQALQLLPIEAVSGCAPRPAQDVLYAVVFTLHGRELGLMVGDVHDIAHVVTDIDDQTYRRPGVMGSFLRDDAIVQLLDPHEIVPLAAADLAREIGEQAVAVAAARRGTPVLLVEDSPFFRRQLHKTLEEAGYEVVVTTDGHEGFEALRARADIALVVSDIEMPHMDGLAMVRAIRQEPRWRALPVIAVTSLAGSEAEEVGLAAGFTEYHVKLDRERLLEACARLIGGSARG